MWVCFWSVIDTRLGVLDMWEDMLLHVVVRYVWRNVALAFPMPTGKRGHPIVRNPLEDDFSVVGVVEKKSFNRENLINTACRVCTASH